MGFSSLGWASGHGESKTLNPKIVMCSENLWLIDEPFFCYQLIEKVWLSLHKGKPHLFTAINKNKLCGWSYGILVRMQRAIIIKSNHNTKSPVDWSCRICQLYLCRGVRYPSLIECPAYDTKTSDGMASVLEIWRNAEYPFIAITFWFTLTWNGSIC